MTKSFYLAAFASTVFSMGAFGCASAPTSSRAPSVAFAFNTGVLACSVADAPRSIPLASGTIAIDKDQPREVKLEAGGSVEAYLKDGVVWAAWRSCDSRPYGAPMMLARVDAAASAPSIAVAEDKVLVAFDARDASGAWIVRLVSWEPGQTPSAPRTFEAPAGGPGGDAVSPSLAFAGRGAYLLAWTEGGHEHHAARAQTIDASGAALGAPVELSSRATSVLGGPRVSLDASGEGSVSFVASRERGFEIVTARVRCP